MRAPTSSWTLSIVVSLAPQDDLQDVLYIVVLDKLPRFPHGASFNHGSSVEPMRRAQVRSSSAEFHAELKHAHGVDVSGAQAQSSGGARGAGCGAQDAGRGYTGSRPASSVVKTNTPHPFHFELYYSAPVGVQSTGVSSSMLHKSFDRAATMPPK